MCVATRWHVLFTEAARCRSGHSTSGGDDGRPNIRVEAKTNEAGQPVGLNFVEFEPGIGDGTWFRAGEAGDHDVALVLAGGWSSIEAGRVWSNKPSSSLVFEAPPRTAFVLHIEVETSLGASRPDVEASVSVNGEAQALWTFNQTNNGSIREVRLLPSEDGRYTVEFSVDSLASARKLGLGDDRRQVGIALGRIDVAAAP